MDELFHRTRGEECGSDFKLDALVGGELSGSDAARLQDHIGACSRCASRHKSIRGHATAFAARPFAPLRAPEESSTTSVRVTRRHGARSLARVGFPLAAAALLIWLIRGDDAAPLEPSVSGPPMTPAQPNEVRQAARPAATAQVVPSEADEVDTTARQPTPASSDLTTTRTPTTNGIVTTGTRTKGGASLEYFVERDGRARRGVSGDVLHPGDRIRFSYTSDRKQSLVILSIDGAGAVSRYHPVTDDVAAVENGKNVLLDASVVLDDVVGEEHVFGLFCSEHVDLEDLQGRLERDRHDVSWPVHCTVEELVFDKQLQPTSGPDDSLP